MPRSRPAEVLGSQTPTHRLVPRADYSLAQDCYDIAELVGIELDPYQRDLIEDICGVDEQRRWAAFEVVIEIARQNGKSVVLYVIVLTALYVWRLRKIVFSAHETGTAMKAFRDIEELIEGCPALKAETPDRCFRQGNGKEAINLPTKQSVIFRTRTKRGGRGLSGDLVIMDEAQELQDAHIGALMPILRAQPNPLIIYAGSAGDQTSTVLGRLIRRIDQKDDRLVGWRFAGDEHDDPADPASWAKTNPALGRRVSVEWMRNEQKSMPPAQHAREIMCIGDYPREDGEDWVIPATSWKACQHDPAGLDEKHDELCGCGGTVPFGQVVITADAKPDQTWASIAIGARAGVLSDPNDPDSQVLPRPGGGIHVEVVDHQRGVRWLEARLLELLEHHNHVGKVVIDAKGPLARMVPDLEEAGIPVRLVVDPAEARDSCMWMYDAAVNTPRKLLHRGQPVLTSALAAAATRPLMGGFAWRRYGQADISPLCAASFAGWSADTWATKPVAPPQEPRVARARPTRSPRVRGPRVPAARVAKASDLATANF